LTFFIKIKTIRMGKSTTTLIIGLAAGTLAGILIAPRKGSETRRKLGQAAEDISDSVKESFCKLSDSLQDIFIESAPGPEDNLPARNDTAAENEKIPL
jgi:gas vesicle protein